MKIEYNMKGDATMMADIKVGECFWFAGHLYLKIADDGYNAFDISSNERVTFNEKKDVNTAKAKVVVE